MDLIEVDGKLTLEESDVSLYLIEEDIAEMAAIAPLQDEIDYYNELELAIDSRLNTEELTSRRLIVISHTCISAIQLLIRGRDDPTIIAYCRSMSSTKAFSDLGFLSRMALKHRAKYLTVHIGSFHVVMP